MSPQAMRIPQWIPGRADLPGLLLATAVGVAALGATHILPRSPFVSDVLLALFFGALLLNTPLRSWVGLVIPSAEREPDRYAAGLRFVGKWVLRLAIILMGFKVQTAFFQASELILIFGVALVAMPSAFFVAHAVGSTLSLRRPLSDLLAGGTMICGASAVNAIAPVAGARREEQGVALGAVFLFSVVALLLFRPIAAWIDLDPLYAGIWAGLSVNDMSSAVAVGKQMGADAGVMAAASKSARVLLLAPALIVFAILRAQGAKKVRKSAAENLPRFLLGYIALAVFRALGDRYLANSGAWLALIDADDLAVDLLMSVVAAGIGLHLRIDTLLSSGARALVTGGAASLWMAGLTLGMVALAARAQPSAAALVGILGLLVTFTWYRLTAGGHRAVDLVRRRYEQGAPLSMAEAVILLNAFEQDASLDDTLRRKLLVQLHPTIGELIPVRESPLAHGEGCRWLTYWEGQGGWALVAICREPGSVTPIHAHPHRLLGKTIEGALEELRFIERSETEVELTSRRVLAHNELCETNGLADVHVVRVVGESTAIDLQLRGPEQGGAGRRLDLVSLADLTTLPVGTRLAVKPAHDERPGHRGEGASAGRAPTPSNGAAL